MEHGAYRPTSYYPRHLVSFLASLVIGLDTQGPLGCLTHLWAYPDESFIPQGRKYFNGKFFKKFMGKNCASSRMDRMGLGRAANWLRRIGIQE
jgi:hypothetical protein